MERCKREVRINYEKCKEEREATIQLLGHIIKKQELLLKNINEFSQTRTPNRQNFIIQVSQLNYALFTKLLAINIDLESCLESYNSTISTLEEVQNLAKTELQVAECPIKICYGGNEKNIISHPSSSNEFISKNFLSESSRSLTSSVIDLALNNADASRICNLQERESFKGELIDKCLNSPEKASSVNSNSHLNNKENINDSSLERESPISPKSQMQCSNEANVDQCYNSNGESINSVSQMELNNEKNTSSLANESLLSTNLQMEIENEEIYDENILSERGSISESESNFSSVSENNLKEYEPESKTESKMLCLDNAKDRFERKFGGVQTIIPDLSFIKDDSSEYLTASDIDGSISNTTDKSTKSKKSTRNNLTIAEHYLPHANDQCVVTNVDSPSEFYITLVGEDLTIALSDQLNSYALAALSRFKSKREARKAIDQYCIAYSEQFETWNRAKVLKWNQPDDPYVAIQYIDFGEYAIIPFSLLLQIPDCFCRIPKQAIRCHIKDVAPINDDKKIWTDEVCKFFESICFVNGAYQQFKIISIEEETKGLAVDLMPMEGSDLSLREALIISEKAENSTKEGRSFMIEQINSVNGVSADTTNDKLKALDDFCNKPLMTYKTVAESMMGYDAQDDMRLCKFARPDGTCFKGQNCRLEHKMRRKGGVTTDTEDVLITPDDVMPHQGETISLAVTHYSKPDIIFGHIKNSTSGTMFRNIFKLMNKKQTVQTYEVFEHQPAVGELVIVKNIDDRWYRAKVLQVNTSEWSKQPLLKVFLVDFGDTVDISNANVRKIRSAFAIHPHQAIPFRISNIRIKPAYDYVKFSEFAKKIMNNTFSVTPKYSGAKLVEGVFVDEAGNDLGTQLIQADFAEAIEDDIYPVHSSRILVN